MNAVYQLNFTNEGGVGGTTRVLKNIAGLWLVQECRRIWKLQGREFALDELILRAGEALPLTSLVNPDDPSFVAPKDMPAAIRDYCTKTGQIAPATEGAIVRTALESLALRYRMVLGYLEELVGGRIETIHIVGGGAQNRLLCQMTADACEPPRRRRSGRSDRHRQRDDAGRRPRRDRQHRPGPRDRPHELRRPGIQPQTIAGVERCVWAV